MEAMSINDIKRIKRDIEASICRQGSPKWDAFWDVMWEAAPYLVVAGGIAILLNDATK
jgi:hypothetical protein